MKEVDLVLGEVERVVNGVKEGETEKFVKEIVNCKSVRVIGAGRSGYVGKSFAMRLGHLGLEFGGGLLIVLSGSGETKETLKMLKGFKGRVVCLTMNRWSSIAKTSDLVIEVKAKKSKQPLRSLFEQFCLIYLDGVVMRLMKELKVSEKEMWERHK